MDDRIMVEVESMPKTAKARRSRRGRSAGPPSPTLADIDITDARWLARWRKARLDRARVRVAADMRRLRRLGIIDDKGNIMRRRLPKDMEPDSSSEV